MQEKDRLVYFFSGINEIITKDRISKYAYILGRDTIHGRINARQEAFDKFVKPKLLNL